MCVLCLGTVDELKPAGIVTSVLGDEIFISIANFSACDSRFEAAGPSANCCGVSVRNLIFMMASRIVGCLAVASFVGLPTEHEIGE